MLSDARKAKQKAYAKEWYQRNLVANRDARSAYQRDYREKNPHMRMWLAARDRAKKFNLLFDITPNDIVVPNLCPVFKVPLKVNSPFAPSLDKIIPHLGYTKGNVQVISKKANVMKQNASPKELEEFARWVLKL